MEVCTTGTDCLPEADKNLDLDLERWASDSMSHSSTIPRRKEEGVEEISEEEEEPTSFSSPF